MVFCYVMSVIRKYPVGEKVDFRTAMEVTVGFKSWSGDGVDRGRRRDFRDLHRDGIGRVGRSLSLHRHLFCLSRDSALAHERDSWQLAEDPGHHPDHDRHVQCLWRLTAYLRVPGLVAQSILGVTDNPILIMLILNGIMLFLGMIMDMAAIILVATPVLLPIAIKIGIDPIHFGIIMMLNLGIGLITPPVGNTLFIGSAIAGISIEQLTKCI